MLKLVRSIGLNQTEIKCTTSTSIRKMVVSEELFSFFSVVHVTKNSLSDKDITKIWVNTERLYRNTFHSCLRLFQKYSHLVELKCPWDKMFAPDCKLTDGI